VKLPSPQLWYFDQTSSFAATKVVLRRRPEMVLAEPLTVQKALGATKRQVGVHRYPPHAEEALKATSALADFILIPTRPAIRDLRAIADTVGLERGKPAAIVLNSCPAGKGAASAWPRQ
jgi:hypothetical protein